MQSVDPLLMWSTVSGVIATFVTAALTPVDLPGQTKRLIALIAAILLAIPVVYLNGQLLSGDYVMAALWILFIAVTTYDYLWKPFGVAPAISNLLAPRPNATPPADPGGDSFTHPQG